MSGWTHRVCERCWFDGPASPTWDGPIPGVIADGEHAGSYRQPTQMKEPAPEPCCGCGGMTMTGTYLREEPRRLLCQGEHEDWSWSRVGAARPPEVP